MREVSCFCVNCRRKPELAPRPSVHFRPGTCSKPGAVWSSLRSGATSRLSLCRKTALTSDIYLFGRSVPLETSSWTTSRYVSLFSSCFHRLKIARTPPFLPLMSPSPGQAVRHGRHGRHNNPTAFPSAFCHCPGAGIFAVEHLLPRPAQQLRPLQHNAISRSRLRGLGCCPLNLDPRERREMQTRRLIASSRHPTPHVGDLVAELLLGLFPSLCSIGASRSISTPLELRAAAVDA